MSGPVRPDDAVEAAAQSSASLKAALAHANGWAVLEHADVIAVAEPRRQRAVVASTTASRGDLVGLVDGFFRSEGASYVLEDHWARSWSAMGFTRVRADPIMLRPAGLPIDEPVDHGLEIRRVRTPEELGQFETVLVEAMPITGIGPGRAGALWRPAVLNIDGLHLWLGFAEGTPVATACGWRRDHILRVYWVTVRSGWRGRGYGAAMTSAAIASDRPSVLASTSSGRPVYERLGFRTVGRSTRWQPD